MNCMISGMEVAPFMNKRIKRRVTIVLLGVILCFVVGTVLYKTQENKILSDYNESISKELTNINSELEIKGYDYANFIGSFDFIYRTKANAFAYMMQNKETFSPFKLQEFRDLFQVTNLFVVSRDGKTKFFAESSNVNFSRLRYRELLKCFEEYGTVNPFSVTYLDGSKKRYYSAQIDENTMAVVEADNYWFDALAEQYSNWSSLMDGVSVGNDGSIMVIDERDDSILYHTDSQYIGRNALDLGLKAEEIDNDIYGWINFDGQRYYSGIMFMQGAFVVCMVPAREILYSVLSVIFTVMVLFVIVMTIMIIYSLLLIEDKYKEFEFYKFKFTRHNLHFNKTMAKRLGILLILGLLVIMVLTDYMQTLTSLTRYSISNTHKMNSIRDRYFSSEVMSSDFQSYYSYEIETNAKILERIIECENKEITNEYISQLSDIFSLKGLDIFDSNGTVIASSYDNLGYTLPDSSEKNPEEYALWDLLNRRGFRISSIQKDENENEIEYIDISLYDESKGIVGIVQMVEFAFFKQDFMVGNTIYNQLRQVVTEKETVCVAISKADNTIAYYPVYDKVGKDVSSLGLDLATLKDNYSGYMDILGEKYYADVAEVNDYYLIVATPMESLLGNKLRNTLIAVLISGICLFVMFILLCMVRKDNDLTNSDDRDAGFTDYYATTDRWKFNRPKWVEQSSEQKLFTMLSDVMTFASMIVTLAVIIISTNKNSNSIIVYVLEGNWERGVNLFSITAVLIAISIGGVVGGILRRIFSMLADTLTPRGTTIVRMMMSSTKYIIVAVLIIYALRLFGVDPSTLLVSAGAVTAVVALSANALFADILAGLFLIFEGEFRVGDIVSVDGWRGEVLDIGIRTTKIQDDYNNVKIISNSHMSGIINMTKEKSYALIYIGIDYGESISRVEKVFEKELPLIKDRVPNIIDGPKYTNVDELGDNAVILRIIAQCKEKYRPQLERDLRRELLLIFERNNINVPYPQITINQQIDYDNRESE